MICFLKIPHCFVPCCSNNVVPALRLIYMYKSNSRKIHCDCGVAVVLINRRFIWWRLVGKLNVGKKTDARKNIGSNICKMHLVHVHLPSTCIPAHFYLLFSGPVDRTCWQEHFRTRVLHVFSYFFSFLKTERSSMSRRRETR